MSENGQEKSLETSFAELEAMIEKLGGADLPLDEAIALYQKGTELIKDCRAKIDTVEKKMEKLTSDGEIVELEFGVEGPGDEYF